MARIQTGRPLQALETVDEATAATPDQATAQVVAAMERRWVIGAAADAAAEVRLLAERYGVDEVMVSPVSGAYAHEGADGSPGRERTLELLARELLTSV
ncbi:hypothetical protein GCM10025877_11250 [Agromyces mangrovi Wang et al. 2018]|nr:hypothetical protein GCM10025877_11250 [Agromyces mangrovi]